MAGKSGFDGFDDAGGLIDALKDAKVDINKTTAKAWSILDGLLDKPSLDEDDESKAALAERVVRCAASQHKAVPATAGMDAKAMPGDKLLAGKPTVKRKDTRKGDRHLSTQKDKHGCITSIDYERAAKPPDFEYE